MINFNNLFLANNYFHDHYRCACVGTQAGKTEAKVYAKERVRDHDFF